MCRLCAASRGGLEQQLAHRLRPILADVLRHVGGAAADTDLAVLRLQLAREDPQQRRLADAVGADEAGVLTRPQLERHLAEQQVATGVGVGELIDDDV